MGEDEKFDQDGMNFGDTILTNESIIDQTYFSQISPHPSFPKRGIPPFFKGRAGRI